MLNTHHTETKAMIIQRLRQEAADLRAKKRDFQAVQDHLIFLEHKFSRLTDDKHRLEKDYHDRCDSSMSLVQNLKTECDSESSICEERRG